MAESEPPRVLLDTNVVIAYLLDPDRAGPVSTVVEAGIEGAYSLLLPEALLAEVEQAINTSEYLSCRIRPDRVRELAGLLLSVAEPLPEHTAPVPTLTRDPHDDYLVAYALLGRAGYLVTGDHDLLVLDGLLGLRIVTPRAFAALLASRSGRLP